MPDEVRAEVQRQRDAIEAQRKLVVPTVAAPHESSDEEPDVAHDSSDDEGAHRQPDPPPAQQDEQQEQDEKQEQETQPATGAAEEVAAGGEPCRWIVGDRVEARFLASKTNPHTLWVQDQDPDTTIDRWFSGRIAKVGTGAGREPGVDVEYDDGDYEKGVLLRFVRLPSDGTCDELADESAAQASNLTDDGTRKRTRTARSEGAPPTEQEEGDDAEQPEGRRSLRARKW